MYTPKDFNQTRPDLLHGLIEQYPLACIVAVTGSGIQANHVPVIFEPAGGTPGKLKGHIARANSLWREIAAGAEVLAIFQGASHYISPSWYPAKREHGKVVPTWNYTVVHVRGRIAWMQDAGWLRDFLQTLTDRHERQHEFPWRLEDAPADYLEQMLAAIVGFEISIDTLSGKWKLSQNRSAADREGVIAALAACSDPAARKMATLVAAPDKGGRG